MKKKPSVRFIVTALLAGLILGMSVTAFAASHLTTGPKGYFGPLLNINYSNRAGVWHVTDSQPYWAAGWTTLDVENPTTNLPPTYLGARAFLYLSDGTLLASNASYKVNSSPAIGITTTSPHYNLPSARYYYSKGLVRVLKGVDSNGSPIWSYYYTPSTPNIIC